MGDMPTEGRALGGEPPSHSAQRHSSPIPALLFDRSITSLGVMRSLARRGIPVFMASPTRSYIARSRWYRPCPNATETYPSPTELAEFLEDLPFRRAVLFPCADDWVRAVASLDSGLCNRFPASVASPETIASLMDKARLAAVLERLRIAHPATAILSSSRDLEGLPDRLFDGAFLKPRDSLSFVRQYWTKGFRVRDKEDALARFRYIEKMGHEVMLQEFIPGSATDHYFIDGFMDRQGTLRAIFARRRIRIWPPDFGSSSYGISVPLEMVPSASEVMARILGDVRYRGIFSAEFVRDPRDGQFRLLEVNVRPFVPIGFTIQCGVDLPWMAYRDALGLPVERIADYEVGRRFHNLDTDLPSAVYLIMRKQLSSISWLRSYMGADGLAFTWDDPAPGLYRAWVFARRLLRVKRWAAGLE